MNIKDTEMNIKYTPSVVSLMKEQAWVLQSMFSQEDDSEKRKELCAQWNSFSMKQRLEAEKWRKAIIKRQVLDRMVGR